MSEMDQTRKWPGWISMSVLPSGADIIRPLRHVRKVPEADMHCRYDRSAISGPRPRQPAEADTPSNFFCAATPAPGLRPLVWVNAP
jgi:hypothetical protein